MKIVVQYPTSPALLRRLGALRDAAKPNSRALQRVREDFRLIVAEDHYGMMIRGVDRYGKPRAPLAPATLAKKNRGPGPSLIPRHAESRFITHVRILWVGTGADRTLVKRFIGIVNDKGQSFAQYHLTGARKPGTRWVLPRRDVGGITPAGFRQLKLRHDKFTRDLKRAGAYLGD